MRVLIVDTALGACSASVVEDGRLLGLRFELMTKGHQERLAGMARDAVADAARGAGGGFEALDRIGVTVGPGSFTGLRVGMAFAQGLGAALDRPVVGLSTLDALAASIEPAGLVAAVIDARRGQVYARLFRDGVALGKAEALSLETATDRILAAAEGAIPTLVGSGALLLSETFPDQFSDVVLKTLPEPTPEALARLTAADDPATALPRPLYLRAPDATPPSRLPGQPRPPLAS